MAAIDEASLRQRAPRGARTVSQAFLTALESIPEARRQEVAKHAQATIRTELKALLRKRPMNGRGAR